MDYTTYQTEAAKTAIYPKDRALEYTALGMMSEVGELAGAYLVAKKTWFQDDWKNVLKELGDLMWYVSEFARTLDIELGESFGEFAASVDTLTQRSKGFTVVAIAEHAGEVAGAVKKYLRDEELTEDIVDGFYGTVHEQKALGHLRAVVTQAENLASILGTDLGTVMEQNLAKLKDRQDRGVLHGSGDTR